MTTTANAPTAPTAGHHCDLCRRPLGPAGRRRSAGWVLWTVDACQRPPRPVTELVVSCDECQRDPRFDAHDSIEVGVFGDTADTALARLESLLTDYVWTGEHARRLVAVAAWAVEVG